MTNTSSLYQNSANPRSTFSRKKLLWMEGSTIGGFQILIRSDTDTIILRCFSYNKLKMSKSIMQHDVMNKSRVIYGNGVKMLQCGDVD